MAGLCLGGGIVSTAAYKSVGDGRITFQQGWPRGIPGGELPSIERAVLITIRNSALDELNTMDDGCLQRGLIMRLSGIRLF